ncbi:MAG: hypothetical protein J5950_10115 [Clostridia bacterium]|nr:hypothetical protein [Clostridia bacterium]
MTGTYGHAVHTYGHAVQNIERALTNYAQQHAREQRPPADPECPKTVKYQRHDGQQQRPEKQPEKARVRRRGALSLHQLYEQSDRAPEAAGDKYFDYTFKFDTHVLVICIFPAGTGLLHPGR